MDTGPIIAQRSYDVLRGWGFKEFQNKGLELEYDTYWRCIHLFINNRLKVKVGPDDKQLVVDTLKLKLFAK